MAVIDYTAIAEDLKTKITKAVKSSTVSFTSNPIYTALGNEEYMVQVECMEPTAICDIIASVIEKHNYGFVIREETHEGQFDWQADTYIKDSATITFGVKTMAITKNDLPGYVSDMFFDFLYYNRKGDEDFTVDDANDLPNIVTKEELMAMFAKEIDNIYD